ncbi:hypothetical protein RB213_005624 [Colletotrichum asianum]
MIIPTANLTIAPDPISTAVSRPTGITSASSFSSLGINEILTIAFGIVASLTAFTAVMLACMQLKLTRLPRPAGIRRTHVSNDMELRHLRRNARASSAPPAPGRNSIGSTLPGNNTIR